MGAFANLPGCIYLFRKSRGSYFRVPFIYTCRRGEEDVWRKWRSLLCLFTVPMSAAFSLWQRAERVRAQRCCPASARWRHWTASQPVGPKAFKSSIKLHNHSGSNYFSCSKQGEVKRKAATIMLKVVHRRKGGGLFGVDKTTGRLIIKSSPLNILCGPHTLDNVAACS